MIDWLPESLPPRFPPSSRALTTPESNGLLAAGGALTPLWLTHAYASGIFPWFDNDSPILWWSPAPRTLILPSTFRIGRTLKKSIKRSHWRITFNLAFEDVIHCCAAPRKEQSGTWITHDMMQAYVRLHHSGLAHSAECWDEQGNLIGGLYGVQIGAAFFGESMFSKASGASKQVFAHAAPMLFAQGIRLIDCQMHTNHLASFGAQPYDRDCFESFLGHACKTPLTLLLPSIVHYTNI